MSDKLLEEIRRRLNDKTIHELRQLARAVGVPRPAEGRKERLLDLITRIASGENDPVAPAVRGAHPKSGEYDRQLVADILRCREICLSSHETKENKEYTEVSVGSGLDGDAFDFSAAGILENSGGKWFMHLNGVSEDLCSDVYVNDYFVSNYGLREGDLLSGKCKRTSTDEIAGLSSLKSVNGVAPDAVSKRRDFNSLSPVYPDKRLLTLNKIIDLFSPVGAGQRVLVTGGHGSGRAALIKEVARGIKENNPQIKLIILSVDCAPEEAADYTRLFADADVFTSPFGSGAAVHVRTARLALEYAKRHTEMSKDVVLVLDDMTKLTRAYNSCGKQVYAALDSTALDSAKKFLAAARNAEEGGSLTIISSLNADCNDPVDAAIFSGLKDICNNKITLSQTLAQSRVYPPIDLASSGAYGYEKLLSEDELELAAKLRGKDIQSVINYFKQG